MGVDNKDVEPRQVEMGFGTCFTSESWGKDAKFVVMNVEPDNVGASRVIKSGDKEALEGPGNVDLKNIKEIIGVWSKERILAAFANRGQMSPAFVNLIEGYSTQPSRVISISLR